MPTIQTGDIETYYEDRGKGPPIILVHAAVLDHHSWSRQVTELEKGHRLLAYDMRGHGQTRDSTRGRYSVSVLADDLGRFIAALGLRRPVVCGWSMGGMVALTYASRNPSSLAGLVLAGAPTPPILSFSERLQRVVMPRAMLGPARLVGYKRLKKLLIRMQERAHGKEAMGSFKATDMPPMTTRAFVKAVRSMASFHRTRVDLAAIRVPTLVLSGDREPPFIHRHARRLQETLPRASVSVIPGAGHAANMDQPELFNQAVRFFLEQVEK